MHTFSISASICTIHNTICRLLLSAAVLAQSLEDCMNRTRSLWETRVVTDLAHGLNVLVVAHGNSLRGLVKLIDKVSDDDIEQVEKQTYF